jgi:sigma-B regulation protein RsbU (phosphoserine phosphatase)
LTSAIRKPDSTSMEMYMRLLVVDDSEYSRAITQAALASAGYSDIRCAKSAWEAFEFMDIVWPVKTRRPQADIILLDVVMPAVDGIEACARIRSDTRYSGVPIIMVTAVDDIDRLTDAFVAGASDYVTKPIVRADLLARVGAALQGQR